MLPGLKTSDGALYVTNQAPAAGDTASGGVTMSPEGWVRVNGNSPQQFDQGKGFMQNGALCVDLLGSAVAGYANGLPVTATGALKCQLNQPVSPGDAYVGGLRVGPLGGLYIVDAAPVWTPAILFASGEQGAWYDPSDLSTMFQDAAGTIPVTADGQPVGKILDKSGNDNDATQATAAARPLYKTDGTYHWLQFDGVDDGLASSSINLSSVNLTTLFSGLFRPNDSGYKMYAEFGPPDTTGGFYFAARSSVSGYEVGLKGSAGQTVAITDTASPPVKDVVTVSLDYTQPTNVTEIEMRVDSVPVSTSQLSAPSAGDGPFGNFPLNVGKRSDGSLPMAGNIYALIFRGSGSTPQEITDTETWVNGKTGAY